MINQATEINSYMYEHVAIMNDEISCQWNFNNLINSHVLIVHEQNSRLKNRSFFLNYFTVQRPE